VSVVRRPAPVRVAGLTAPDAGALLASEGGEAPIPLLPHERDERALAAGRRARRIELAAEDVASDRVDTDCRGAAPARECAGELPALLKPPPESRR
jgi:hypothetical protein